MAHSQAHPATSRSLIPADEMHFFERVKRALDNRETYNEFLKVVNLFTQDYIGWDELKEREYLMAEFQNNWTKPTPVQLPSRVSRIDPSVKYGSYRRLSSSVSNTSYCEI
jgi:paired amphipathic helix protein Sin3a